MSPSRHQRQKAFSLVEVVIAMGVVSFAFVALFGMLPMGLQTFRQAIDTNVQATIAQQMAGLAEQTAFTNLTSLATSSPYYFDDQGIALDSATNLSRIYTVYVEVNMTADIPSTSGTQTSTSLATLKVHIINKTKFQKQGAISVPDTNTFTTLIADTGK